MQEYHSFSEYHFKAAEYLTENLQIKVTGYNTLCSCVINGMTCEVTFCGKSGFANLVCTEAIVTVYRPGAPNTPQNFKRHVVGISESWDIAQACAAVSDEINRLSRVTRIIVKKRGADWHAQIEGKAEWASGKSHIEAIGDLVLSHPDQFGVEVKIG
jgi:hypothetical protein